MFVDADAGKIASRPEGRKGGNLGMERRRTDTQLQPHIHTCYYTKAAATSGDNSNNFSYVSKKRRGGECVEANRATAAASKK